jgi:hypothetical protein
MTPRQYELRIEGRVSEDVARDFTEFEVREAPPETVMYGEIADDAQLHGVLARLQDLGLRVTSLRTVPEGR